MNSDCKVETAVGSETTDKFKGELRFNEPMAQHTSWHIGGVADRYYRPADSTDLAEFLASLPIDEPITWLGLGSNVLIHDNGIRGTVIHMQGKGQVKRLDNENFLNIYHQAKHNNEHSNIIQSSNQTPIHSTNSIIVQADAGVACAKLAKICVKEGYIGGEFFAGIPGTVGGALAMNAGAFGGETWRQVALVEVMNRKGERYFRLPEEYKVAYRSVRYKDNNPLNNEWFISGYFHFTSGNGEEANQQIKQSLRKRNETQPIGVFSCGSVFKNPPDHAVGRLIESCNLKGFTIGGAQISPKHANFIINLGNASAEDVLQLIKHVKETILKQYNIQLETEVRLLGW